MSTFEQLKEVCSKIYKITVECSSAINQEDLENIAILIQKKDLLLEEANKIYSELSLSDSQKTELNEFKRIIKILEDKNIKEMENKHSLVEQELFKLNKNQKAISAYKFTKEVKPRLFDEIE